VPLDLTSMTVDHVIPESLLSTPTLFDKTKSALGLPDSFDINSFENWMPACGTCNGKKAALQFSPSLLIQVELQHLAEKAEKARQYCNEIVSDRKVSIALNVLERAKEGKENLEEPILERLAALVGFASEREHVSRGQPLRLTQSFRLVTTTLKDATNWGVTHWSMPPRDQGEQALVVLFGEDKGECVECGLICKVFQPINQEGGGDPICGMCLSILDWIPPVALGDFPTHITLTCA